MSGLIKSSTRALAIVGLAIGLSAMGFAQSNSIVNTLNNQAAVNNTQNTVQSMHKSTGGSGGSTGGHSGGGTGGHSGGGSGGNGGGPGCVPEPASMLALGVGTGLIFLKKRSKKA